MITRKKLVIFINNKKEDGKMKKLDEFIEANKNLGCNIKIFNPLAELVVSYVRKKHKGKSYFDNKIQSKLIICGILLDEIANDMIALGEEKK